MELNALATADDPDAATLPGAPAEDRDFNAALRRRALVKLDKFFAVKHDSREATNVLGNNVWAKQAYAFVHMCLYGYKGKYQKAFATFLQRSAREPVTEEVFKECFNMTYKKMLLEIRGYCDFTVYESKYYKSKEDVIIPPPPLELREATQGEIGRIKGEALLLAGHAKAARGELAAAYQRGERDPNLLGALGLYERAHGEEERARTFLEAAFIAKTNRSDALLELARYRHADAVAKPEGGNDRFSAAQTSSVMQPLLLARKQPPPVAAVYDLAGDALVRSAVKSSREEAVMVVEGAQLFPLRLKLVYQATLMAAEIGELKSAHALAAHGIKYSPDPSARQRFEEIKSLLPPAPEISEAAPGPGSVPAAAKVTKDAAAAGKR
jgi:hypothetical protein